VAITEEQHCTLSPTGERREYMNYQGDLAQGLVDELLKVIHKYDETMIVPTVIGCLEIVKQQILDDHKEDEDETDYD
jgi:hypothetical protein